ncbi:hypothetical protein KC358_g37 [Hortaea werneckii]|nr:hypothetical protein KC358_g37 [Hortaea werneckii]
MLRHIRLRSTLPYATTPRQWSPAVAQWFQGDGTDVGYLVHYGTESAIDAEVTPGCLKLTYPYGNSSSIFTFLLSPPTLNGTLLGWGDADGLDVKVTIYPEMSMNLTFAGMFGGASETIHDFEFYNFTYTLPKNFTGQPWVQLEMTTQVGENDFAVASICASIYIPILSSKARVSLAP